MSPTRTRDHPEHKRLRTWLGISFGIMLIFLLMLGVLQARDPVVEYHGGRARVSELVHQGKSLYCTPHSPPGLYHTLAKHIPLTLAPFICFDTLDELNVWLNTHPQ